MRICRVAGGRSWTDFANICVRGRHSYGRCVCLGASAVGPGVFLRCRSSWVESPRTCAAGEIVAIDGQTFRGRDVRAFRSLRWTKLHPWRPLFNLISHSHRNATDRDSAFPISDRHPQSTVGALSCSPSGRWHYSSPSQVTNANAPKGRSTPRSRPNQRGRMSSEFSSATP